MKDLYEQTIERSGQIKKAGYYLIEMWECNWTKSKEYKEEMKRTEKEFEKFEELSPRNAFFGGRTNATKLKVKGKKMKYIDVCCLYPTVQCYDDYPVGHPTKTFKPSMYRSKWYGLIKCAILPPRKLYHSVLPVKNKVWRSVSERDYCFAGQPIAKGEDKSGTEKLKSFHYVDYVPN
jgi:hypothetical protein